MALGPLRRAGQRERANVSSAAVEGTELHAQLLALPAKEEALAIANAFMTELYAQDQNLPPHLYAAIWH